MRINLNIVTFFFRSLAKKGTEETGIFPINYLYGTPKVSLHTSS